MTEFAETLEIHQIVGVRVSAVAPADQTVGMEWLDTASSAAGGTRIVNRITTSTTVDNTFDVILVDASSGAVTITLPPITRDGKVFDIKKVDSSANAVTVDGDGTEPIDDALTVTLSSQYDDVSICAELSTAKWWILP